MLNQNVTRVLKSVLFVAFLGCSSVFGQSPFDGFSIQEVPMDPTRAASIQTVAGFTSLPRCWRVYVCMNADNWELQGIAGTYNGATMTTHPWTVECSSCTGTSNFYNDPLFGGFLGDAVNPAFYAFDPNLEYDSWFFLGTPNFPGGTSGVTFTANPGLDPTIAFENGGDFVENSTVGSVLGGFWSLPSSQGKADADYRVLIAQLTTDGVFDAQMTLQFRQLNPDNTLFLPTNVINDYDVTFTNFPGSFDETCPQVFLPVELIEFNAAASDDRVNLLWKTASERNAESFSVEHSTDLTNWSDIGELPAAGNSDSEEEYFLVHKEPEVGVNYYRLRQTDHNGTEHHSDVRSAVFKASEITFYPNPASDRVWFKGDLAAVQSINVYDMQGKLVLHQNGNSDVIREMDINQLERGAYVVEFIYVDGTSYRNKLQVNG